MLDLIIRGGQVVTPEAVGEADVGVKGEKIVALAAPNTLPTESARVIDATGKIVVPGGIEPHAHIAHPIYTQPGVSGLFTAGATEDTRAAAFGGVTTIVDFSYQEPGVGIMQSFEQKDALFRGQSYIDYSFHCILKGQLPASVIDEIPQAIAAGFPSMKIFTTHVRPATGFASNKLEFGYLWPVFEQLQKHSGVAVVHAEDDDIVQYMYQRLQEEGRTEGWNMHLVHNNLSEDLSFRRVTRLAQQTGTAVYFVHVSAKEGVSAIAEARSRGLPVYGETLHNYASFTSDDYRKPRGLTLHTYPSLKSEEDRQALWQGLLDGGALSTTATDEYSTSLEIKLKGKTIMDVTGGHNGVEARMGIVYTEGVIKQGMSLQRYAEVTSTNAARILGFYPRKGAIAPGSDADIAIIDPGIHKKLSMDDLHISDYSIWEGWEVHGWPVTTILRGKVIVDGGKLLGQPGDGQLIPRKVGSEVLSRPVC